MNVEAVPVRAGGRARAWRGLACALAVPLLASCVFEEDRPALSLPTPTSFRDAPKAGAPPLSIDWPLAFGSAELGRLAADAQVGNLDIQVAVARITQARAQATLASVPLYPQLTGSTEGSRNIDPGTARSKDPPFRTTAGNLFSLGLTASYQTDFWGRYAYAADAADALATASRFDRDTIALSTAATVADTYFTVLASQDRLRIARDNIATASRVLEAFRGRLTVGTSTGLEVAEQESVVALQRASIPPLEQAVSQAKNQLAVLTGRAPSALSVKGGSLDALKVPRVRAGLPAQLLTRRPDIAAAEERFSSNEASVQSARAAFLPSLSLTGRAGTESVTLQNLLRPEALFASLAGSLTQPLFDGYNLQGTLDLARGRDIETLRTYRKTVLQALLDVENALVAVARSAEHETLQRAAVEASRRAYAIVEERLKAGTIDIVTVLNTQQTLFSAQDMLVQTRLQRFEAAVALFQALGGGWTIDGPVGIGAGVSVSADRPIGGGT